MRIVQALRRLATRGSSSWPVLSVYVNTRPVGPQMLTYRPLLKMRMAEELAAFPLRSPDRESLAVDFARVQHYLDYDLGPDTQAAAVFSSYAGDDMFDAVQLPIEFPGPLVTVSDVPTLFPLLIVADRARRAVALVAGPSMVRLFVSELGGIEIRREVRAAATGADAPRFARDAAQALADLGTQAGAFHALIGGDSSAVGAIRAALPAPWGTRLLDTPPWDLQITENALGADVFARVEAREQENRIEGARALVAAAAQGRAVLGADATRTALREERIDQLLFGRDFPDASVREELSALAMARGTAVHVVPPGAVPAFDAAGVGALRG